MARQRSFETGARRCLSASFEDCISCVLCGDQHSHFSTPSSWKNKEARSLALSLQVQTDSHVCRPCRDNLGSMSLGGGERQRESVALIIVGHTCQPP